MDNYEIEKCVVRAKNGSEEDMLKIFEQYKPFIIKTAKKFNIKNYELTDLLQVSYIALMNVVKKYEASSNTFSAYAFKAIVNAIGNTGRKSMKYNREFSLNAPIHPSGNTGVQFLDFINSMDNVEEDVVSSDNNNEIRKIISKLPEDEMNIVIALFYKNLPLKTYAKEVGMCYPTALRKKRRALERLEANIKKFSIM